MYWFVALSSACAETLIWFYQRVSHIYMLCVCSCVPLSVWLPVWAAHWFARVRDAVPLLHRPTLRLGAPLCFPHPAAVHPQRDQHSEIHQVRWWHTGACMYTHQLVHLYTHMVWKKQHSRAFWGFSLHLKHGDFYFYFLAHMLLMLKSLSLYIHTAVQAKAYPDKSHPHVLMERWPLWSVCSNPLIHHT